MNINWEHIGIAVTASLSFWSFLGHAVSTYPVPKSPGGKWFLSCIQYAVGQRLQALATAQGQTLPTVQQVRDLPNGTELKMEVK